MIKKGVKQRKQSRLTVNTCSCWLKGGKELTTKPIPTLEYCTHLTKLRGELRGVQSELHGYKQMQVSEINLTGWREEFEQEREQN